MFVLPDELPATVSELDELAGQAQRHIAVIQARHEAGDSLSPEDVDALETLLDAVDQINSARAEAATAEAEHQERLSGLLGRAGGNAGTEDGDDAGSEGGDEGGNDDGGNDDDGSDAGADEGADAGREVVTADGRPVSFAGAGDGGGQAPAAETGPGWVMAADAPGYQPGRVGFAALAQAIDSVRSGGSRAARRGTAKAAGSYFAQTFARLGRDVPLIEDSHALVREIERVTTTLPGLDGPITAAALTAAGGWCAPSEQLYDFCDVPDAVDLISLPEITINRGGIRWPQEPDLSEIFESFQFFFTEPELEAVDAEGKPTAFKECVEIPCPDEFTELRLRAVGYCVEAGILQTQGWPELIEWFMRSLAAEHLRAISRRTILDMVAQSGTPKTIPAASIIGAASSVLNSLALQAVNLRLNKGLARTATIEGVAPSWFHEVLRADLAMQEGLSTKSVTDGQINQWLTDRNIALQYVGDWQTREAGLPGNLATVTWPDTVDIMLYPAGTWFRSMSNVIELGVMYPKEQLQVNRYTRFFTEDAMVVGKRCNQSIVVRVPLQVSGAIGQRQWVTDNVASPQPAIAP
ncbi:major capsid hexamer protein [Gordonia phage Evaa]|nr:major capsid hexamer protein [Gordonia phage Evaa]